jgi:hypothetical protein
MLVALPGEREAEVIVLAPATDEVVPDHDSPLQLDRHN